MASFSILRWRTRQYFARIARAARYAAGKTPEPDAWLMFHEMETITGWHALEGVSGESVLEYAQDRWGDVPELPGLVAEACARVASKWNSSGDTASAAEDWAMNLIQEYAAQDGIVLSERDVEDAADPEDGAMISESGEA